MAKFKSQDLEVTKDDQNNINSFSKYHLKKQELEALLKIKKELVVQNDDALAEMEMNDDTEIVPTRFGVCFINISSKYWLAYAAYASRGFLESDQSKLKYYIAQLNSALEDTNKRMNKLKATLYSKFGNSINLYE